jgi:hypothetical protein
MRQTTPDILGDVLAEPTSRIRLDLVRTDGGTQSRLVINDQRVTDYAELMSDGVDLGPIAVTYDGTCYWLVDGFHRVQASRLLGRTLIAAQVTQGTQEDAVWASYGANKGHGLNRTQWEINAAVKSALRHPRSMGQSNRELARHIGVNESTVRYWREKLEASAAIPQIDKRQVTRGGTTYSQDTSRIGRRLEDTAPTLPDWVEITDDDIEVTRKQGLVNSFLASYPRCGGCDGPVEIVAVNYYAVAYEESLRTRCTKCGDVSFGFFGGRWNVIGMQPLAAPEPEPAPKPLAPTPPSDVSMAALNNPRYSELVLLQQLYKQVLASLARFGTLTGRATLTLPARRALEDLLDVLSGELRDLGA